MADEERSVWAIRAEHFLEQALDEVRDGIDAIPAVTGALMALRIECGEASEDEMPEGSSFPGEDNRVCICPPELLARDGFRGGCPVHSSAARSWEATDAADHH